MTAFESAHAIAGTGSAVGYSPEVHLLPSITHIPKAAWKEMLPGEPECWDFYRCVESAPPPGFTLSAIAASEDGRFIAAAPVFSIDYRLDTPFQGTLRVCSDWLSKRWPRLLTHSVLGLGSPMSDSCTIGFAPHLLPFQRRRIFSSLLAMLGREAQTRGTSVLAVKSLGGQAEQLAPSFSKHGFRRVTNLPIVALPLPYQDMDHYLGSLSHNARRSLKRKMRSLRELRIEMRNSADGVEDQLFPLFENTRNQSKYRYGEFEDLNRDLFKRVMGELGEKARLILCWKGDKLVCFLLMLVDRDRIIGKYIGMVYPEAREFNLYSLAVLKLIESAMECRIGRVELGVSTYPAKLLFGGHMERRWLYYRCLNPWLDAAHVLDFLFDFERNDKDVRRLSARVRD